MKIFNSHINICPFEWEVYGSFDKHSHVTTSTAIEI